MISDEQIQTYVNKSLTEQMIRNLEEQLLNVMKIRQEQYPSDVNDAEWLAYTNFVCRRRCQRPFDA